MKIWVLVLALGACVDPLTSDDVVRPELVLPAGSQVELVDADKAEQIDTYDGLDTTTDPIVRASTGFAKGTTVRFWDFGEASATAIPLYKLVIESSDGDVHVGGKSYASVPHAPIFDKVPGDAGYSPWWTVVLLPVSERYDGQLITSFDAVEEARRQGLVGADMITDEVVNCPVVAAEARLQRAVEGPPEPPTEAYYRGRIIKYFSFDYVRTTEPIIAAPPVYQLRREGGEPLTEAERGVDMTADGDLLDTNDVFAFGPGDPEYTGLVRATSIVVVASGDAIDTSADQSQSDFKGTTDLFDDSGTPRSAIISVAAPGRVLNRPIAP